MWYWFNLGCNKPGVYGSSCNIPCPIDCKNATCHIQNGTCFDCKPGWTGTTCVISKLMFWLSIEITLCITDGYYFKSKGIGIDLKHKDVMFLWHLWIECGKGLYGENCSQTCSEHCKEGSTCNHVTGQCEVGCNAGWKGAMCDQGDVKIYVSIISFSKSYSITSAPL